MSKAYDELRAYMDKVMVTKTAMVLLKWDNKTLAPRKAGEPTSKIIGVLSGEYFQAVTREETKELLEKCRDDESLTTAEATNVRGLSGEREQACLIPRDEYQEFARLTAGATSAWARIKRDRDFEALTPTLKRVIGFQGKFAGYRARGGKEPCDVILNDCEKGLSVENLDRFFGVLKKELVPFLKKVMEEGKEVEDSFSKGGYPKKKQEGPGWSLAEYVGSDFDRGVMAVSAHSLTVGSYDKGVRIIAHCTNCVDSSLSSAIHETGHAIYEPDIGDNLALTPVDQGAGMGMHGSQPQFFKNIIGRSRSFWVPIYVRIQEVFPEQLGKVDLDQFVEAVNKATSRLIRTETDGLSYSLHALIRYKTGKMLIEEDLGAGKLPQFWADKYEEYLGVCPKNLTEEVLQDIHWSQGSSGYFLLYAPGSVSGAQLYCHMKETMGFDGLLREGEVDVIWDYLREHIHQYERLKGSRQILKDMTGEDFKPEYYVRYLKEKYSAAYGL